MKQVTDMYRFSSKLWYNNRAVSANGDASLYLQVTIDGKHREFNLKLRWPIKSIDLLKGKLLARHKDDEDVNPYNVAIGLELHAHNEINRAYLVRKENLDIQKFVHHLKYFNDSLNFNTFLQNERDRRYNNKPALIDKITYKNAGSTITALNKFDPDARFSNINKKWMIRFKAFLQNHEFKKDCKYEKSTIWSFIKVVKAYLRIAADNPLIYVCPEAYDFENPEPRPKTEFLDREELRRLFIIQNTGNLTELQERVLKAFLFQCYTGLRISDIYNANNEWQIAEDYLYFLPFKNRKRGDWLKIPLMGPAKKIIKNATGSFFNLPNKAQYNETLKILDSKAQINKNLKSHMGRHTFGFLFMTSVGNIFALQKLLGHKKITATERYSHLNDEYQLQSVRKMAESFSDYTI